jgi:hypothetical protein
MTWLTQHWRAHRWRWYRTVGPLRQVWAVLWTGTRRTPWGRCPWCRADITGEYLDSAYYEQIRGGSTYIPGEALLYWTEGVQHCATCHYCWEVSDGA